MAAHVQECRLLPPSLRRQTHNSSSHHHGNSISTWKYGCSDAGGGGKGGMEEEVLRTLQNYLTLVVFSLSRFYLCVHSFHLWFLPVSIMGCSGPDLGPDSSRVVDVYRRFQVVHIKDDRLQV